MRIGDNSKQSRAAVYGHPIHPFIVVFPIAFLVGTLASDVAFWSTLDAFWSRASTWLLGAGIVMGLLASVAGLIDFLTISHVRSLAASWVHLLGNATAIVLSIWNVWQRLGDSSRAAILPYGIMLSPIAVAIYLVTGWLGGELVFRHRIGMIVDKSEVLSLAKSPPRSPREPREVDVRDPSIPFPGDRSRFTKHG